MAKMITGVVIFFLLVTLFAGMVNGGGGINETILIDPMTTASTDCKVQSTGGFLSADKLVIDGEELSYTSADLNHFYGLVRSNPKAHTTTHTDGSPVIVYSQQTSILNNALNFNVSSVSSNAGGFAILAVPYKFFTTTLPSLIRGSNPLVFLPGELAFIGYFWVAIAIGIVIALAISIVGVAAGVISKVF